MIGKAVEGVRGGDHLNPPQTFAFAKVDSFRLPAGRGRKAESKAAFLTNARELFSRQHLYPPHPANHGLHLHPAGRLRGHLTDDGRLSPQRVAAQPRKDRLRLLVSDNRQKLPLIAT